MKYMLMLYADEAGGAALEAADMERFMREMHAYKAALEKARAFVATAPLAPTSAASTVRVVDGAARVEDGPYAETREQLGGYFVIEATDMDEAQAWAARCPAATWGTIEVRPILDMPGAPIG